MQKYITQLRQKIANDLHWKEILSGSGISFILKFVGMAFNYLFIFMITRWYGADAFGVVALTIVIVNIVSLAARLGIDSVWLRFIAEYASQGRLDMVKGMYRKSFKLVIPISLLLSAVFYVLSPYLANNLFHKESLTTYFQIGTFAVVPLVILSMHGQAIRAMKKIALYSFYQYIVHFFFACVLMLIAAYMIRSPYTPLLTYVVALYLGAALSYVSWKRTVQYDNVNAVQRMTAQNIMKIAVPMLISSSMVLFLGWTDTLLLGIYRTEREVGLYSVALKIAMVATFPLTAISSIAAPKFAESYARGDLVELRSVIRKASKLNFLASLPLFLMIAVFPGFLLGLFGKEFAGEIVPLLLLATGQFFNAATGPVAFVLQMTGKEHYLRNVILLSTAVNLIANLILIPSMGTTGAALANMVSVVLWNVLSMLYIRKYLQVNTFYLPTFGRHR